MKSANLIRGKITTHGFRVNFHYFRIGVFKQLCERQDVVCFYHRISKIDGHSGQHDARYKNKLIDMGRTIMTAWD